MGGTLLIFLVSCILMALGIMQKNKLVIAFASFALLIAVVQTILTIMSK